MLKFSGYPRLIRGQPYEVSWGRPGGRGGGSGAREVHSCYAQSPTAAAPYAFRAPPCGGGPITKPGLRVEMALEQACPPEYQGAQCAFKDSMIH
jgi:hypothetical protein